jgi:hypothetical protein
MPLSLCSDIMPSKFDTPMFWSDFDLAELQGTSVVGWFSAWFLLALHLIKADLGVAQKNWAGSRPIRIITKRSSPLSRCVIPVLCSAFSSQ